MWQQAHGSENVYEGEVRYENNQVVLGKPPNPPLRDVSLQKGNERGGGQQLSSSTSLWTNGKIWAILGSVVSVVVILLLVGLFIQISLHDENTNTVHTSTLQTITRPPGNGSSSAQESTLVKSCKELGRLGFKADGIYHIQVEDSSYPKTEVFCDMTSDGGGWTLVASVHESNIHLKCGVDDMWSTYDPIHEYKYPEATNWESENVFGNLHKCAKKDYKNSAYHKLQASDIMVWHVDPNFSLSQLKSNAYLRYRTYDRFLERYGGNLKTLYQQHYPLKSKKLENPASNVLNALVKNAGKIRSQIPDWYDYTYGEHKTQVKDSGMYSSYGNQIIISSVGTVKYEEKYRHSASFIDSKKTHPFMLVNVIMNENSQTSYFYTQVYSYRKNGNDDLIMLSNNITSGNYHLQYHALQYSSPNIPTPCEFHFVVSSDNWGSGQPSKFWNSYRSNTASTYKSNGFQIDGYPTNVVMGYMLLARKEGKNIKLEQADRVAGIILDSLTSLTELFNDNRETRVINALARKSADIRNVIPDWYMYTYRKGSSSRVYDSTLYNSNGNQVHIKNSNRNQFINYGNIYDMDDHRNIIRSRKTQPFILVNIISNEDRALDYFITRIDSQRNNNEGDMVSHIKNIIIKGNYKIQYNLMQFSYSDQPTPAQFHFVVSNTGKWRSVEPSSFTKSYTYFRSIYRQNEFKIDGGPCNIVMGYLLLTRQNGGNVTALQSDSIARIVLDAMISVDNLFNEYPGNEALDVPIIYDKGGNSQALNMIPPDYRAHVEPGYLQFRAYNFTGYPNAFCPGVRVKSISPEYSCIGGLSNDVTKYGTCGDFAGWGGKLDDVIAPLLANGSAHSQQDLSSAILIFYR